VTRSDLISILADKHPKLTASDVELVVKAVIDSIGNQLIKGGRHPCLNFFDETNHLLFAKSTLLHFRLSSKADFTNF
jgi:hypothetical protein